MITTIHKSRLARHASFLAMLASASLNVSQFRFLAHIHLNPGSGTTHIADALGMTNASITEIFQALRKRGLVQKTASTTDERRIIYTLTEAGTTLLAELCKS